MNPDIIKAFLIQIGFQVKKGEQTAALGALTSVGKAAFGVASALTALATAAAAAATAVAASFDKLYYVSQRTNTSVQNIRSLSYAFGQVGGSSDQAVGAIESFQRAMRTNPGVGSFVRSLGVATEAGGKARDNLDVLMDSIDAIQKRTKGQQFAGAQMAAILGMDEHTYDMMLRFRNEIKANGAEYDKWTKLFGIDAKASSAASNEFMHNLREISTIASLAGQRLLLELLPGLSSIKQAIVDWLNAHPELIEKIFRGIGQAASWIGEKVKAAYEVLAPFLSYLSDQAEQMWEDGSFLRAWEKVAGAFERTVNAIKSVLKWLNDLDRATDMSSGLNAIKSFLGWVDRKTSGAVQEGLGTLGGLDRATDTGVGVGSRSGRGGRAGDGGDTDVDLSATPGSNAKIAGATFRQKAPGVMQRLMEDFKLNKEEAAIVLGNLGHESAGFTAFKEGGNGPGRGWAQWTDPGRKARFFKYAQDNKLDPQSDEANYGFLKWELQHTHKSSIADLKNGRTTSEKMTAFQKSFEGAGITAYGSRYRYAREAIRAYDAARQGGKGGSETTLPEQSVTAPKTPPISMTPGGFNVNRLNAAPAGTQTPNVDSSKTVQQNNPVHVTVSGASDPAATGQAVEGAVNRANERSLRNAQTAIR